MSEMSADQWVRKEQCRLALAVGLAPPMPPCQVCGSSALRQWRDGSFCEVHDNFYDRPPLPIPLGGPELFNANLLAEQAVCWARVLSPVERFVPNAVATGKTDIPEVTAAVLASIGNVYSGTRFVVIDGPGAKPAWEIWVCADAKEKDVIISGRYKAHQLEAVLSWMRRPVPQKTA